MHFGLTEEQTLLKDSIEKFIQNDYDFETRCKFVASDPGFNRDFWKLFAELGWLMVPFAEDDGGLGGGPIDVMVLMEQFGKGLVVEPYLSAVLLGGRTISTAGSAEQKAKYLGNIMSGDTLTAMAWVEPQARFDLSNVATRAEKDGDGWTLSGSKAVVLGGNAATLLVVPARTSGRQTDADGISLFLVEPQSSGVTRRDYATVDGFRASEIAFDTVVLPENALLGDVDKALPIIEEVADYATLAVCAEALGIMDVLLAKTLEYTKTRVQFGVPISSFQVLQHRMVDMLIMLEQTRSLLYMAAMTAQSDSEKTQRAISAVKYYVGTWGKKLGQEAVQLHGGMGVSEELDVGHYFKRLTMIDTQFGNADYHLTRFADL